LALKRTNARGQQDAGYEGEKCHDDPKMDQHQAELLVSHGAP